MRQKRASIPSFAHLTMADTRKWSNQGSLVDDYQTNVVIPSLLTHSLTHFDQLRGIEWTAQAAGCGQADRDRHIIYIHYSLPAAVHLILLCIMDADL